jgi:hypothetical protein
VHLSGQLVAWKGHDSYEDILRMSLAEVKSYVLDWHLEALLDSAHEPCIYNLFERDTTFDPAGAAGAHIHSTSGSLFQGQWILLIGIGESDQLEELKQRRDRLRQDLEALLPPPTAS